MTLSAHAALVTASFHRVDHDALVDRFYGVLFDRNPGVRSLFPADMREQKRKLGSMLGMMVRGLSNPEALVTVLDGLGYRHAAYDTKVEHFPAVGDALVSALAASDPEWTPEVASAWSAIYEVVTDAMTRGLTRALEERAVA